MSDVHEFVARAEAAEKAARTCSDPEMRAAFLKLAQGWRDLAAERNHDTSRRTFKPAGRAAF